MLPVHELILGGRRSGKSRCGEARAADWLRRPGHDALLIATALPGDAEMARRIERHRVERAQRLPGLRTLEISRDLAPALRARSAALTLLVVDCLTLWLTQLLMPPGGGPGDASSCESELYELLDALRQAPGPVVLVSNEIGLGVTPLQRETRQFLDTLGELHQRVAALCERVTLMVAGVECRVKP